MENRSPYVLIGAAVLVFIAAAAGFVIWKLRAGERADFAYYEILFGGEVQGLTPDSPVFYRGIRVGRVDSVNLTNREEPHRVTGKTRLVEKVAVVVAVEHAIDIRDKSYAVLEKPLVAGQSFVQIVGRLDDETIKPKKRRGQAPYPEIREGASFFQATSASVNDLLSKAATTADRVNEMLNPDNLRAISQTLASVAALSTALSQRSGDLEKVLSELAPTMVELRNLSAKMNGVVDQAGLLLTELGPQDEAAKKALAGRTPSELKQTLASVRTALGTVEQAAGGLNKTLASASGPVKQFTETGLTEFAQAIRELRALTANLNVIATKIERDPAGYVFGGKQGYSPR
jgi:phospholipid/cholesterol/gamma-HCH transport system substrate-binding protein